MFCYICGNIDRNCKIVLGNMFCYFVFVDNDFLLCELFVEFFL